MTSSPGTPPEPTRCRRCHTTEAQHSESGDAWFLGCHTFTPAPLAPSSAPRDVPAQEQEQRHQEKTENGQLESRASQDAPVCECGHSFADHQTFTGWCAQPRRLCKCKGWRSGPGRALDVLVAEKVMGWKPHLFGNFPWQMQPPDEPHVNGIPQVRLIPHYSTDIGHAWLVVEKLRATGYEVCLYDERETAHHGRAWEATVGNESDDHSSKLCDTAPLAICRAALAAVEAL